MKGREMKRWIASKIYLLSLKLENLALKLFDPDADIDFNEEEPDWSIAHTEAGHIIMFPSREDNE